MFMRFGVIVGSHRKNSQSTKVSKFVLSELKKLHPESTAFVLDLHENPLPLWDESRWADDGKLKKLWNPIASELSECDSFVIITPEWSGMVTPGLKNFFLNCDFELAHKPATIVAVSSGRGGSYPVAELRMSSYKNTHICYIPEHAIVQKVEDVLNDDVFDEEKKDDFYIKNRISYCLEVLGAYSQAFKEMREKTTVDMKKYPYGM